MRPFGSDTSGVRKPACDRNGVASWLYQRPQKGPGDNAVSQIEFCYRNGPAGLGI